MTLLFGSKILRNILSNIFLQLLSRVKDSFIGKGKGFNTANSITGEKIIRFLKEAISIEIFRKTQLQCKSQINGKNATAYYLAWLNCSKLSTNPFFKQINVVSSVCVVWKSKKTCQMGFYVISLDSYLLWFQPVAFDFHLPLNDFVNFS